MNTGAPWVYAVFGQDGVGTAGAIVIAASEDKEGKGCGGREDGYHAHCEETCAHNQLGDHIIIICSGDMNHVRHQTSNATDTGGSRVSLGGHGALRRVCHHDGLWVHFRSTLRTYCASRPYCSRVD